MDWLFISLHWYIVLFFIGIIFLPLTKKVFGRFSFDHGYAFAKTISIIAISYISYVLGTIKLVPFTQWSLILIFISLGLINILLFLKNKHLKIFEGLGIMVFEEVLFLVSFIFWTYVRSQEPSIHSLEKFMDFGFINSILRSRFFPPLDMWYTPLPINYYYFGHLTGAILIKLTNISPYIGYNLILSTIFALSVTQVLSLVANIISFYTPKIKKVSLVLFGIIGSYLLNLGGNLHTIYVFTTGYPPDNPIPFWQILSTYNPLKYWYPNATRFIPFTIHEFPSYSYVVADLHGHVFDIPFVLLTLSILFLLFNKIKKQALDIRYPIVLGFLTAIHYMTNAFDGPIYVLLSGIIFLAVYGISVELLLSVIILLVSFAAFSLPFSYHFTPFVNGIGVNCSPDFLVNIGRIGPFLFEKDKCQISPLWMLFVLWGFFWISFIILFIVRKLSSQKVKNKKIDNLDFFIMILFSFSIFLTIIPEFFYIKDIYPAHFRANTMFKLGYQAFMMMSLASAIVFFRIKQLGRIPSTILSAVFVVFAAFVFIYPYFSIPSYYGNLDRPANLDGTMWLKQTYPEDKQIVDFLNTYEKGQPVILEAQGDSYTDYERISAMTGLPTVAGWWVHEWLWRGSSDVVGKRIPEVSSLYESPDIDETMSLIKKYHIKYIIISRLERQKYPNLNEEKFGKIARLIFKSSNGFGALYQVNSSL